ncbi:hypothetical protein A3715_16725 [Oleiphilus sp. HI0009]|nr:hypothetical protein A3715_16725 [Oleiphilus sp. HI0009]
MRRLARTSDGIAKGFYLLAIVTRGTLRHKLISLYLQSDANKNKVDEVLSMGIKSVAPLKRESTVTLSKSAVVKAPTEQEKGVLIVGFEHELDKLTCSEAFEFICEHYLILFMPTWQPFYSDALLRFLKRKPKNLIILPSSRECYYKTLSHTHYALLPFHASSWIDEKIYSPQAKTIDILMLANFATYKRHKLLFEALRSMPRELRVVLVGRPAVGRTARDILAEAKACGVEDRFELIQGATNDDVRNYLCSARLVLGLSGREGSYVGLAEALFADTPVAIYADAVVGTKNYVNPQTGFLIQPKVPLSEQLAKFLELASSLQPRDWAIRNISAKLNNQRLNYLLARHEKQHDRSWSRDCDQFRIQSFQFEPMSFSTWSEPVIRAADSLAGKGFVIRTQVDIDE